MERFQRPNLRNAIIALAISIVIVLLCILFGSCKTKYITQTEYKVKEVPVEVHDTSYVTRYFVDSVVVHDSVYTLIKGDTVYRDNTHIEYRWKVKTDTIIKAIDRPVVMHDTIMSEKQTVETKVEYKTHWWQSALDWGFGIALVAVLLYFIYRKFRSKLFFII